MIAHTEAGVRVPHTHLIKVTLVLLVLVVAPVVTEAGFRLEARVDWTISYPRQHRLPVCGYAHAQ